MKFYFFDLRDIRPAVFIQYNCFHYKGFDYAQ